MPRLRYDGPGHVLNAFGRTLLRGDTDDFTAQEAEILQGHSAITVAVVAEDPPPRIGAGSGKDAWAVYAAGRGINVDGLNRGEIIAAVDRLEVGDAADNDETPDQGDEPEAQDAGEGQSQPDKQEE